jgi:hypothetical protein
MEAHGKVVSQFIDKDKDKDKDADKNSKDGIKTSAKEASAKEISAKETSTKEALAKEALAKEALAKEALAKKSDTKIGAKATPIFTVVRAPDLVYDEDTRIANYTGGAALSRPGLAVAGRSIRAFLSDADASSSLDKAFADGEVKIVHTAGPRTRVGTSEHAEYYTVEQKVLLAGGNPLLVDSLKGETKGRQLTWFANNDRLLVNGVESRPADSLLRKK